MGRDDGFMFFKALGFIDFPTTKSGTSNLCDPKAFEQTAIVILSLDNLWPGNLVLLV